MGKLNVLVVDDDVSLANIIKFKLSSEAPHFSVSVAEGGQEALDYVVNNTVDCILSDYQMPGMSGIELLQNIRNLDNDVPFIFITGQGSEEVARDAFRSGASDYFTKDWGFAYFTKIINSVERAVNHRELERTHVKCSEALVKSEQRYRAFVEHCSEAIWRFEMDPPIPVSLSEDEQIELLYENAYLAECNDESARTLGMTRAEEVVGWRLKDIVPKEDPRNIEHLRRFIRSEYRLLKDEVYPKDANGHIHDLFSTFNGVIEDGYLVRAWGVSKE